MKTLKNIFLVMTIAAVMFAIMIIKSNYSQNAINDFCTNIKLGDKFDNVLADAKKNKSFEIIINKTDDNTRLIISTRMIFEMWSCTADFNDDKLINKEIENIN